MYFRNNFLLFLSIAVLFLLTDVNTFAQDSPEPSDLLEYEDPQSVAISPDGNNVLLRTERADIENNTTVTNHWLASTRKGGGLQKLDLPDEAKDVEWFPDSKRIAYLAPAEQGRQVWIAKPGTDKRHQITNHKKSVRDFALSPDGKRIAYSAVMPVAKSPHNDKDSRHAVEVNQRYFVSYNLFSEELSGGNRSGPLTGLWISDIHANRSFKVSDTLSVEEFSWSPSGNKIALTATPQSVATSKRITLRSDLYLFSLRKKRLETLFTGEEAKNDFSGQIVSYSSPFWSPSGKRLGFERTDRSDVWTSVGEVGILNLQSGKKRYLTDAENRELSGARYSWLHTDKIFVEYTDRAQRGLFTLSVPSGEVNTVYNPPEYAAGFSFSEDGTTVSWMEESIGRFPETYFDKRSMESPEKITDFNKEENELRLADTQSIEWTSSDGTKVQGWLVTSGDDSDGNVTPLLTLVHGGPGATVENQIETYSAWPYPVQVFAARGYTVFIPNYRGTNSFGKEYQEPEAVDREPVADIITGIEYLLSKGIAEKDKLGIMGHSHGGWLGPIVAAEYPHFQAASFAEGRGWVTFCLCMPKCRVC